MPPTHDPLMGSRINWKTPDHQSFILVPLFSLFCEPSAKPEEKQQNSSFTPSLCPAFSVKTTSSVDTKGVAARGEEGREEQGAFEFPLWREDV